MSRRGRLAGRTPEVDVFDDGPWPGPVAYQEDGRPFVGRESETDTLVSLIEAYSFVLLHAPSGAGKSSLVNAAVIPRLRAAGYAIIGPGRVMPRRVDGTRRTNPYAAAFLDSVGVDHSQRDCANDHLMTHLVHHSSLMSRTGDLTPTLVIFDQFEEVLAVCDDYADNQRNLMQSIGEAALVRDNMKALFIVRDDQLGPILRIGRHLPTGDFTARMHLDSVSVAAAPQLLTQPAFEYGKALAQDVVFSAVQGAAQEHYVVESDGGRYQSYQTTSEYVGLVTLQVVAKSLWDAAHGSPTIGNSHLEGIGDVAGAVRSYYEDSIAAAAARSPVSADQLRDLFETELISSTDQRQLAPTSVANKAVGAEALAVLETRAVVRKLTHGPGYFELCHDSFIRPVRDSNQDRRRETRRRARRRNRIIAGVAAAALLLTATVGITDWLTTRDVALSIGESSSGTIQGNAETDTFTVTGVAGETFRIILDAEDALSPLVAVGDPDGQPIAWDTFLETGNRKVVIVRPPVDGTYRVNVWGANETTGSYDIAVESFQPELIEFGQTVSGSIEVGEVAVYEFDPGFTSFASVRLSTEGELEGLLEVTGPTGNPIASFQWPTVDEVVAVELAGGGPFRAIVRAVDDTSGTFRLSAVAVNADPVSVDGPPTSVEVTDPDDVVAVELRGGSDDNLVAISTSSELNVATVIWLPGADGSEWILADHPTDVIIAYHPAETDYLVSLWSMNDEAGTITVEAKSLSPLEISDTTDSTTGAITGTGDFDVYQFLVDPRAEATATILEVESDFDAKLFSGPFRGAVESSDGAWRGGTEIVVSGPNPSGKQVVAVTGYAGSSGQYEVSTMSFEERDIDVDTTIEVTASGDRFDVFAFTGQTGQGIAIEAGGRGTTLVRSAGSTVLPSDDGTYQLRDSSRYYLFVAADTSGSETGYTITVRDVSAS